MKRRRAAFKKMLRADWRETRIRGRRPENFDFSQTAFAETPA